MNNAFGLVINELHQNFHHGLEAARHSRTRVACRPVENKDRKHAQTKRPENGVQVN